MVVGIGIEYIVITMFAGYEGFKCHSVLTVLEPAAEWTLVIAELRQSVNSCSAFNFHYFASAVPVVKADLNCVVFLVAVIIKSALCFKFAVFFDIELGIGNYPNLHILVYGYIPVNVYLTEEIKSDSFIGSICSFCRIIDIVEVLTCAEHCNSTLGEILTAHECAAY